MSVGPIKFMPPDHKAKYSEPRLDLPTIFESEKLYSRWAAAPPTPEEQKEPQQSKRKEGHSISSRLRHKQRTVRAYTDSRAHLILSANNNRLKGAITHVSGANQERYGFTRNPNHPLWKNKKDALKTMDLRLLERHPSNATFHNLTGKESPFGSEQLLCVSLKFCVQEKIPTQQVNKMLTKLRRAVRLCTWLDSKETDENEEDKNKYIPGLYLPSTWVPHLAPPYIENGLAAFAGKLKDHFK
jgi:hypothetical protein